MGTDAGFGVVDDVPATMPSLGLGTGLLLHDEPALHLREVFHFLSRREIVYDLRRSTQRCPTRLYFCPQHPQGHVFLRLRHANATMGMEANSAVRVSGIGVTVVARCGRIWMNPSCDSR